VPVASGRTGRGPVRPARRRHRRPPRSEAVPRHVGDPDRSGYVARDERDPLRRAHDVEERLMPARTKHAPGTPSWVDLQTSDPAAAKSFYTALFDWEFEDLPIGHDADGNPSFYSMARKNGKDVAAVAPLPMPGVPPHWNTYITVADVDASAAQVAGAGGTVVMEAFDVMDAG